jgi:hypothetical protein
MTQTPETTARRFEQQHAGSNGGRTVNSLAEMEERFAASGLRFLAKIADLKREMLVSLERSEI